MSSSKELWPPPKNPPPSRNTSPEKDDWKKTTPEGSSQKGRKRHRLLASRSLSHSNLLNALVLHQVEPSQVQGPKQAKRATDASGCSNRQESLKAVPQAEGTERQGKAQLRRLPLNKDDVLQTSTPSAGSQQTLFSKETASSGSTVKLQRSNSLDDIGPSNPIYRLQRFQSSDKSSSTGSMQLDSLSSMEYDQSSSQMEQERSASQMADPMLSINNDDGGVSCNMEDLEISSGIDETTVSCNVSDASSRRLCHKSTTPFNPDEAGTSSTIGGVATSLQTDDVSLDKGQAGASRTVSSRSVVCDVCGMIFPHPTHRSVHMKMLCGLKCTSCGQSFDDLGLFEDHIDTHGRAIECHVCGYKFLNASALECHRQYHAIEATCNICSLVFPSREDLYIHLRTHNYYRCDICFKLFASKLSYKSHLFSHKAKKCDLCDEVYTTKIDLVRHLNAHEKYKCAACSRLYSTKTALSRHLRTHSKETNFECSICEKTFTCEERLVDHLRKHNLRR